MWWVRAGRTHLCNERHGGRRPCRRRQAAATGCRQSAKKGFCESMPCDTIGGGLLSTQRTTSGCKWPGTLEWFQRHKGSPTAGLPIQPSLNGEVGIKIGHVLDVACGVDLWLTLRPQSYATCLPLRAATGRVCTAQQIQKKLVVYWALDVKSVGHWGKLARAWTSRLGPRYM